MRKAKRTHGRVGEGEVQQVFVLNLSHLDDSLIVHALLVALDLAPH